MFIMFYEKYIFFTYEKYKYTLAVRKQIDSIN